MYQISLAIGRSAGYECSVEPTNTALAAGRVGLFIGGTTGLNAGLAARALHRCREELEGYVRRTPALTAYSISYDPATDTVAGASTATGVEGKVSAVISLPAASTEGHRSLLVSSALQQCYEVARELMNSGFITGVTK
jgi:hypothetical protein